MRTLIGYMLVIVIAAAAVSCSQHPYAVTSVAPETGERHLSNLRQLTNGGENAEAYFSSDGARPLLERAVDLEHRVESR